MKIITKRLSPTFYLYNVFRAAHALALDMHARAFLMNGKVGGARALWPGQGCP